MNGNQKIKQGRSFSFSEVRTRSYGLIFLKFKNISLKAHFMG